MEAHTNGTKGSSVTEDTAPNGVSEPKPNIGVYTNPDHALWTAPAEPEAKDLKDGVSLKPGEVTIAIKNTGICG